MRSANISRKTPPATPNDSKNPNNENATNNAIIAKIINNIIIIPPKKLIYFIKQRVIRAKGNRPAARNLL